MKSIKVNKKSKGASSIPVTAQDHLDAGVSEEDHGDRWIGSGDVPKALRFYQRANGLYRKAIGLDRGESWISKDAIYNISRMQYLIFTKVTKNGLLPEIASLLEPETDPSTSVIVDNISSIITTHETALQATSATDSDSIHTNIDLLYNYALVLVEAGEETEQAEWFIKAADIFDKVLNYQINEFTQPDLSSESNIESDDELDNNDSKPTPSRILDTQISFLQCLTQIIELSRDEKWNNQMNPQLDLAKSKSIELKDQILKLITTNTHSDIGDDEKDEALVTIAKYTSSLAKSLDDLTSIWNDESLPNTPHRYLSQADSYLDMQELVPANSDDSILWTAYSLAASILAKAPQPPNTPLSIKRRILLVRGDIDWLRSFLNTQSSIKNRQVLLKNAKVYYQNCINIPSLAHDLENELIIREATVKKQLLEGTPPDSILVKSLPHILHDIEQQGLHLP